MLPVVSRRRVLAGGAVLALFGVLGSACSPAPAPSVSDLEAQLQSARHDAELATAAAAAAGPEVAPALTVVAAERSRHAQALATEIDRVSGRTADASSQPATSTTSAAATPAPAVSEVIDALRTSAESAATLAAASSGYRAGLLGSIAAACTAAYTVALVTGGTQP